MFVLSNFIRAMLSVICILIFIQDGVSLKIDQTFPNFTALKSDVVLMIRQSVDSKIVKCLAIFFAATVQANFFSY